MKSFASSRSRETLLTSLSEVGLEARTCGVLISSLNLDMVRDERIGP